MLKKLVLVSSVLCTFSVFASGSSVLELLLNGTVSQTPYWSLDGGNTVAKQAVYSFNGHVPSNGILDTNIINVALINPDAGSPSVELVLPSNCTIGGPSGIVVNTSDTQFVVGNDVYPDQSTIAAADFAATSSGVATNIRISGINQNVQGALACPANGSLTYRY